MIGFVNNRKIKNPWITNEMIEKMDQRKKWKNINTEAGQNKYKELNNNLRRETDKAIENWWQAQCEELEAIDRAGRSDLLYSKVKSLTGKKRSINQSECINDNRGELLSFNFSIIYKAYRFFGCLFYALLQVIPTFFNII